jgi:hypothetical protein
MKTEKVKVDLRKQKVWIGKTLYWQERRKGRRTWYRDSKTYAYAGDEKLLIKEAEEAVSCGELNNDEWAPIGRRIKDKDKVKQLEEILFRAIKKEIHRRRQKRKLRQEQDKAVSQNEASPQEDTPKQDDGLQKRTKWGVRIYSSDGKHFFNLGCWKSTKYPGSVSIRLGRYLYTVSQNDLKALIVELQRGLQPEIPQEPT